MKLCEDITDVLTEIRNAGPNFYEVFFLISF
jgi:hypothetical protein